MNFPQIFYSSLASVLLVLCPSLLSQNRQAPKKVNRVSPALLPFDLKSETLPPMFSGDSIISLFHAVSDRRDLLKSEYETDAEYHARMAQAAETTLLGTIPLNGEIAIVVPCDASDSEKACERYNADKEELSVLLPFPSVDPELARLEQNPGTGSAEPAPSSARIEPSTALEILETAGPRIPDGIAQNGFGVSFRIWKQSVTRYFVETVIPTWFSLAASSPPPGELNPTIDLKLSAQSAMHARNAVRVLIIGHLSAPF